MEANLKNIKRNRGTNFTTLEKTLLIELVTKYRDVIECKKTDGLTIRQKEAAWHKIAELFKSNLAVTSRSSKQLRQFYANVKREAKKAKGEERLRRYMTSGGPCTTVDVDDSVLSLIEDQIDPSANPYDCDASYYGDKELVIVDEMGYSADRGSQVEIVPMVEEQNAAPSTSLDIGCNSATPGPEVDPSIQTSILNNKESIGADVTHPRTTKASICRERIAALASSRSALCDTEMQLMKEKYANEIRLIDLKIKNEELRGEVLREKLLYYREKRMKINKK